MPCCARRVVSVAPIMVKAKPDDTPRNSAARGAGSRYARSPSERVVIVDQQRRMVGEALRLVDRLAVRGARNLGRGDLVVDAPADVLGPGLSAVGPPRVLAVLLVEA